MRAGLKVAVVCLAASACVAQSLGDVARQQRLADSSMPQRHIITNDDIARAPQANNAPTQTPPSPSLDSDKKIEAAGALKSKITEQKQKVVALEQHIRDVQQQLDSIGSPGSDLHVYEKVVIQSPGGLGGVGPSVCTYFANRPGLNNPYQEWCDRPAKLKADLDKSTAELQREQSELESLQEEARQMGFGNGFYDPELD